MVWRRVSGHTRPARPGLLTLVLCCAGVAVAVAQPHVVPEHPRIFLRTNDLPALQERCQSNPELAKAYASLRKFAYGSAKHANPWIAPDQLSSVHGGLPRGETRSQAAPTRTRFP